MAKNVLIFSDGTGQVGGIHFDEPRTNVYKMYRAMRCGPDSTINPKSQVAFYDPGIGTASGPWRAAYNLISQATGFGITRNIIDCYAAVIRLWEPGDRIWLFGFSRGAYTARCVAEVLALCAIPRKTKDGQTLKLDQASVRKVATYAVKHVYQFTAPRPPGQAKGRQVRIEQARQDLAVTFRADHDARPLPDDGTYPYFVGVFDTVAALINPPLAALLSVVAALAAMTIAFALSLMISAYGHRLSTFLWSLIGLAGLALVVGGAAYIKEHFKMDFEGNLKRKLQTAHMTDAYPRFYDVNLDGNIAYAKHAISIDENRAAFERVHWGHGNRKPQDDAEGRPFFEQVWFAGNHADVGGGYPENESRLSDQTLEWMIDCASEVSGDLKHDRGVLQRWPSSSGPQHDEVAAGFGWFTRLTKLSWPAGARKLPKGKLILHESVYDRFDAPEAPHWDGVRPYRPEPFKAYPDVANLYTSDGQGRAARNSLARRPKPADKVQPVTSTPQA